MTHHVHTRLTRGHLYYDFPLILCLCSGFPTTHQNRHPPECVSYAVWATGRYLKDVIPSLLTGMFWGVVFLIHVNFFPLIPLVKDCYCSLCHCPFNLVLKCVGVQNSMPTFVISFFKESNFSGDWAISLISHLIFFVLIALVLFYFPSLFFPNIFNYALRSLVFNMSCLLLVYSKLCNTLSATLVYLYATKVDM